MSARAGGDCIDDADRLRTAGTPAVLGHAVRAPSTLGTFMRSFTWGHAAQLDRPIHGTSVAIRHRIRIARAIAGQPKMLLVEHPLAGVDAEVSALGADLARREVARTGSRVLAGSVEAARPFAPRVLRCCATGDLTEAKSGSCSGCSDQAGGEYFFVMTPQALSGADAGLRLPVRPDRGCRG
jgi:hypothetical protein